MRSPVPRAAKEMKRDPSLPPLQKGGPPVPESHKNWGPCYLPKTGRASVIFGPVRLLQHFPIPNDDPDLWADTRRHMGKSLSGRSSRLVLRIVGSEPCPELEFVRMGRTPGLRRYVGLCAHPAAVGLDIVDSLECLPTIPLRDCRAGSAQSSASPRGQSIEHRWQRKRLVASRRYRALPPYLYRPTLQPSRV